VLNLLARAKLIELSEDEKVMAEGSAAVEPAGQPVQDTTPFPASEPVASEECEIAEGKSLEEIYAEVGVAASPFPAERLLRLLDGLRAMDPVTRKTAVLAMDAADDNWQIADPVLDAQRKIAALDSYKQHLEAQVRGSEKTTAATIGEISARQEQTVAEIRKQIHELEQLLERELARTTQEITRLEAALRATREAAARERHRMDVEMDRLREIPAQFVPANSAN
jgi:hypothetical protein